MKLMNIMMVMTMLYKQSVRPTLIKTPKLCKDCKFFIANNMECSRFGQVDLVTGKKTYEYARNTRIDEDKCGETAKYFEKNNFKFITVPYYFIYNYRLAIYIIIFYTVYIFAIFSVN